MKFVVKYRFKENLGATHNFLKDLHQEYIANNVDKIVFGGVEQNIDKQVVGILIVLIASSYSEAEIFVINDPYYELTEYYEINFFEQRIPKS